MPFVPTVAAPAPRFRTVPIPHDAVHFFVESELGISDGFWGLVAAGRHPEEVQDIAKAGGHASAGRAEVPDAAIVRMIQAERTVECFEADLWGGSKGDPQTFREAIYAGCAQSLVPPIEISGCGYRADPRSSGRPSPVLVGASRGAGRHARLVGAGA